jgi:two-component system response regulator AlgR
MKILIVDDEPLARERLAAMVAAQPGMTMVGQAGDGVEAVEAVGRLHPDIVLMDIAMPGMDGLEAARHLAESDEPPAVIFCTAYDEHALAAFEACAVDYLVKPVRAERLATALERARRFTGERSRAIGASIPKAARRTHLCSRLRGALKLIPIGEVIYFIAEDKYVIAHHASGEALLEDSLKTLENEFADRVVRIHRNCLVMRDRLVGLKRHPDGQVFAEMRGTATQLEISRRCLPLVRRLMKEM